MERLVVLTLALALLPWTAPGQALADSGEVLEACEEVTVGVENHDDKELGQRVGKFTCQKLEKLSSMFKLDDTPQVSVLICGSMNRWFELTGRSFYTTGVASSHGKIVLQPGKELTKINVEGMLVHELVHIVVARATGVACPDWLNEGLAQWFEGRRAEGRRPANAVQLAALEARWHSEATTVAQRREDYRASLAMVTELVERIGIDDLVKALPDLPRAKSPLELDIRGKSLGDLLFPDGQAVEPEAEIPPGDQPLEEGGITPFPWAPRQDQRPQKKPR